MYIQFGSRVDVSHGFGLETVANASENEIVEHTLWRVRPVLCSGQLRTTTKHRSIFIALDPPNCSSCDCRWSALIRQNETVFQNNLKQRHRTRNRVYHSHLLTHSALVILAWWRKLVSNNCTANTQWKDWSTWIECYALFRMFVTLLSSLQPCPFWCRSRVIKTFYRNRSYRTISAF